MIAKTLVAPVYIVLDIPKVVVSIWEEEICVACDQFRAF